MMSNNANQKKLLALIDWFQVKFDAVNVADVISFLGVPLSYYAETVDNLAGYSIYEKSYKLLLADGIKVYYNNDKTSAVLWVTGKGCRYLEDVLFPSVGLTGWKDFFWRLVHQFEGHLDFRRLDININDFNEQSYFTPAQLLYYCEHDRYLYGRSKSYSVQGTELLGMTLYCGAPGSDRRIRIYDKMKEQLAKGEPAYKDITVEGQPYRATSWVRTECAFRGEISGAMIQTYISSDVPLIELFKAYLRENLHFYADKDYQTIAEKWGRFLTAGESLKISISSERAELFKKFDWLKTGGALAILKAYCYLYDNNQLPPDFESLPEMLEEKDLPLELGNGLISYLGERGRSDLIAGISSHLYDPFKNEKLRRQRIAKMRKEMRENG